MFGEPLSLRDQSDHALAAERAGLRAIGCATRRDLQRAWLDRMTALIVDPPARTPADARAVARWHLVELDSRLERAVQDDGALDAYTRAHLAESRARIAKALAAGLEGEQ